MGPKTQRVYETIREYIESGRFGPGDKLPSERTLSAELEIGRTALRQVLAPLANEHFIRAHDRSSYRVLGGNSVPTPAEMASWTVHGSRRVYENQYSPSSRPA
ncbi:winged helix-turn-helix domain-containing protein [Streptomyces sp. NPDC126503]|uniref:winged helix-turn-helix domain-containing protein n=1 Tax=Streptomyces sp. NPDC126503 TaxID=3155315 RepID=UPI00331EA607